MTRSRTRFACVRERRKERKRIDTSYLRNAVIKETGLRIEQYGDEVARSYSLGDWMKWNSKPSPPSTRPPLNQEWSRAKEKTQTRHINILDMGGRGWGLNFPPWCFVQDCISKKAWRRLRKMEKSCRRTLSNSSYQHVNILKTGKREKRIFIYKSLIHGDSWILSSLFLTCKIKVDASVLFTCYMFHSVTEKLSVHKQS